MHIPRFKQHDQCLLAEAHSAGCNQPELRTVSLQCAAALQGRDPSSLAGVASSGRTHHVANSH